MMNWIKRLSARGTAALFGVMVVLAFAAVLLPGYKLASSLSNNTMALRLMSEQRRQPDALAHALASTQDRLEARGYVDSAVSELRKAMTEFDEALTTLTPNDAGQGFFASASSSEAMRNDFARAQLKRLKSEWQDYHRALTPIAGFTGLPYQDTDQQGTQLNKLGERLQVDVFAALRLSRKQTPILNGLTTELTRDIEARSEQLAAELRYLMLAGLIVASGLALALGYLVSARRRQDRMVIEAQRQTQDILKTVKDGLFLLDSDLRIGPTHSAAVQLLFQRETLAGITFEDLLRPLVPEKTMQTALKFVKVLWSERTRENLVKSINPLGEVEVNFDDGRGGHATRYLEFDFHRVKSEERVDNILVSVNDVSQRVMLARELRESQDKAQAQLDTLLGVLHVDPAQLSSFLDDSDAAMRMVNSILKEPAREEGAFRKKLDSIFRQVHAVKGEASALGLASVESRAHQFEDSLKDLKDRNTLTGNDFLPLVVKLDDLFTHLSSVRDLVTRLAKLNVGSSRESPATATQVIARRQTVDELVSAKPMETHAPRVERAHPIPAPAPGLGSTLEQLVQRIATDEKKRARIECAGLDKVPNAYRRVVKDVAIQIVRNAVVHGIETPEARQVAGKSDPGNVIVHFLTAPGEGYKLVIEDDGQGISSSRIKEAALQKGIITEAAAAKMESKQMFRLLFHPGFSTRDTVTHDAGRGIGMSLVAELIRELNGKIAVATGEGKYTRFSILLPPVDGSQEVAA
ncbi:MAG TPA: ATP-binding protein [Steroidobacteraceae bacterium]|nr:ATP-binding protein [Steroidobacteraceae bacterium]